MFRQITLITIALATVIPSNAQQYGSFKDSRDGRVYKTVKIGNQIWMAENLNVDRFRNGDTIPEAKTVEQWAEAGRNKQPAWCYYDDDSTNDKICGKLYNWYALSDLRGLTPEGWHVPSDEEWQILYELLGQDAAYEKMKSHQLWSEQNGTNTSGFSSVPSGTRTTSGAFDDNITTSAVYWSNSSDHEIFTNKENDKAWYLAIDDVDVSIGYATRYIGIHYTDKNNGFSIRCLKDYDPKINIIKYNSFAVGTKTWMINNLNIDKFRNGDIIPNAKSNEEWKKAAENKQPAWCYYKNSERYGNKYGKLYNWYAVNDPRGLAPEGWHIPTIEEWETSFESGINVSDTIWLSQMISGLGGYRGNSGELIFAIGPEDIFSKYKFLIEEDMGSPGWWSATSNSLAEAECIKKSNEIEFPSEEESYEIIKIKLERLTAKKYDGYYIRCVSNY
jgi:uncharacterized protein (TIGR02145 family)